MHLLEGLFGTEARSAACVEFYFNDSFRSVSAPDCSPLVACFRGPILLARDSDPGYLNDPVTANVKGKVSEEYPASLFHLLVQLEDEGSLSADYASCGNKFDCTNLLRVWLPVNG